jgi:exosome complex RNA-binding protein Rrp42 (RNase PH superfamily)
MTFGLFENNIFFDLSLYEENISKSRLTISMNVYKELCSIHKPGGLGMTK